MKNPTLRALALSITALTVANLVGCGQPAPGGKIGIPTGSAEIVPKGLNDTGATKYIASAKGTLVPQAPSSYPGQDATVGLDSGPRSLSALNGTKGFYFEALDESTGAVLTPGVDSKGDPIFTNSQGVAVTPGCVADRNTGLIWEYKNSIPGSIHYKDHIFTWYNPDTTTNGGRSGQRASESQCKGISSGDHEGIAGDTYSFIQENKQAKLCGFTDWRLPLVHELASVFDYGEADMEKMTDPRYFGNLHGFAYHRWAAETLGTEPDSAWAFHMHNGQPEAHSKGCEVFGPQKLQPGFFNGVMLVRSVP